MQIYGCSTITAVTAQNTRDVARIHVLDSDLVEAQIEAVAGDIDCRATKVGMVGSPDNAKIIARLVKNQNLQPLVIDTSMVAKSGARLTDDATLAAVTAKLFPLAAVVIANRKEAAALLGGSECDTVSQGMASAKQIASKYGCYAAIVTGFVTDKPDEDGQEEIVDVFWTGEESVELTGERRKSPHTHGASATFAAAIVGGLVQGKPLPEAAEQAKRLVTESVKQNIDLGQGVGPINHLAWLNVKK